MIELMIVVIIASVLAVIGLPAYQDHLRRTRIAAATARLSTMQLQLEQYYQDHRDYGASGGSGSGASSGGTGTGSGTGTGTGTATSAGTTPTASGTACGIATPAADAFSYACATSNGGQGYLLTASGGAAGLMSGFTYTLDQASNAKTTALPTGWTTLALPAGCWILRRGAAC